MVIYGEVTCDTTINSSLGEKVTPPALAGGRVAGLASFVKVSPDLL